MTAKLLEDLTGCILKAVQIITYYAPIGFLGFFANLVATYGPDLIGDYSKTLIVYYDRNSDKLPHYPAVYQEGFFRFSIGLEDAEDIIADLKQAFEG